MKVRHDSSVEIEYRAYAENEKGLPWDQFVAAVRESGNIIINEEPSLNRVELLIRG